MTSQTFLMMSIVTSFDRTFKRVFDQTKHCKTFFLLDLNLGELYCELSRLKAGCRTVSNNGSGSGLAPAQNILAVQVWFGFT